MKDGNGRGECEVRMRRSPITCGATSQLCNLDGHCQACTPFPLLKNTGDKNSRFSGLSGRMNDTQQMMTAVGDECNESVLGIQAEPGPWPAAPACQSGKHQLLPDPRPRPPLSSLPVLFRALHACVCLRARSLRAPISAASRQQ